MVLSTGCDRLNTFVKRFAKEEGHEALELAQRAEGNDASARQMLIEMADTAGDGYALLHIGYFFDQGLAGFSREPQKAVSYLERALEKGISLAAYNLGVIYVQGRPGIEKDTEKATHYFTRALEDPKTAALASVHLGRLHEAQKDYKVSYIWYSKAAQKGDVWFAPYRLGYYAYNGIGTPQNPQEAILWLQVAAKNWFVDAAYLLGVIYSNPSVPMHDPILAAQWLLIAGTQQPGNYAQWSRKYLAALPSDKANTAKKMASTWIQNHGNPRPIPNYDSLLNNVESLPSSFE